VNLPFRKENRKKVSYPKHHHHHLPHQKTSDGWIHQNPWARIVSSHVCVTTFFLVDEILFQNQMYLFV
jgi:hypothetical protein